MRTYKLLFIDDEDWEYELLASSLEMLDTVSVSIEWVANFELTATLKLTDFDWGLIDRGCLPDRDVARGIAALREYGFNGPLVICSSASTNALVLSDESQGAWRSIDKRDLASAKLEQLLIELVRAI